MLVRARKMTSIATLSSRAGALPFGDVSPHVAAHAGPGFSKKDLLFHLFRSPDVAEPKASLFCGHWNALNHTILHTTKIDTADSTRDVSWGAEYYGDSLYQDPNSGEYKFIWGGNATLYAQGHYDVFLHNQDRPVYLWAREKSPQAFVNCGRLQWTSWTETTLDGARRPIVHFTIRAAPVGFHTTHAQLFP